MIRLVILFGVFCFVGAICLFLWAVGTVIFGRNPKKEIKKALDASRDRRDAVWAQGDLIEENIFAYGNIVGQHGPDSDAAKALRMGIDSTFMNELHGGSEAVEHFVKTADLIDRTYRQVMENKKRKVV